MKCPKCQFDNPEGAKFCNECAQKLEAKRMEKKIWEHEKRYQRLIDQLPLAIFDIDQSGKFLFVNRQGFRISGYAPEDIDKGLNAFQLFIPEEQNRVRENIRKILSGGKMDGQEYMVRRKDGSTFPVIIYSSPIIAGKKAVGLRGIVIDITHHKQLEQALRASEEKFRTFMDTASDVMNVTDKDLRFTYTNEAMTKIFGYSKEELTEMHVSQLLRKEDLEKDFEQQSQELVAKGRISFETTWLAKNGKEIDGELKVVAIYDNDGKFVGTRGIFRDITERKKMERELRQSAERYRSLIENINLGIMRIDTKFNIVMMNSALGNLLKKPVRKMIGKKCFQEIEKRNTVCPHCPGVPAMASGKSIEVTTRVVGDGDSRNYARVQAFPVFGDDGQATGFIEVTEDVSERMRVELELEESKLSYQTLFENAPVGIGIATLDGTVLDGNKAMYQITGYSEVDRRKFNVRATYLTPEDYKRFLKQFLRDKSVKELEVRMKRKDGTPYDASISVNQITLDGRAILLTMIRDISAQKEAQRRLLAYQDQLRSLAFELSLAEEREQRRIATHLHDYIGNNLAMCKVKLGSLRESLSSTTNNNGCLDEVYRLIEETIQSTRSFVAELTPPALYEMGLMAAVESLAYNFGEQYGVQFNVKNKAQSLTLDTNNRIFLFQAIRELLTNIVKHAQARNAEISIRKYSNKIYVEVKDDGVGFDTSQPLFATNNNKGYGLFNIRERLRHLGGECVIQSQSGCGTRVTLITPLKTKE
jgi:PAS domain S-box-containing protein